MNAQYSCHKREASLRILSPHCAVAVVTLAVTAPALAQTVPLKTQTGWILDADDTRVSFRCINWTGHGEANIPGGLHEWAHRSHNLASINCTDIILKHIDISRYIQTGLINLHCISS